MVKANEEKTLGQEGTNHASPFDSAQGRRFTFQLSISVVLPAYNEEENIGQAVKSVLEVMEPITPHYEVIVVDDGSRDGTSEVVRELAASYPKVRLVRHEVNQGYGGALNSGFKAATGELIFFTSSDNQYDVVEVKKLLPLIETADLVIGYRVHRQDPFTRRLFAWGWNTLVNLLFGYVSRDIDCAFKLFKRQILSQVPITSKGAMIDTELLVGAKRSGFSIVEVPVSHFPRLAGSQTGANIRVILRAFRDLFKFRLQLTSGVKRQTSSVRFPNE
jgi:glycosyltransferase involved in cell wall biosynthesis